MLKPIRYVSCSPALQACRRLQVKLTEWLCDPNVNADAITQDNLKPPRVPTQIEADWLWGFLQKKEADKLLLERAKTLANMPSGEKTALLAWVNSVSQLSAQFQPNPPAWPVVNPPINDKAWTAFKELMLAFYKKGLHGSNGLPYQPDGTPTNKKGVNYDFFVQAFRDAHRSNSHADARQVCVLCGGALGDNPEVDHWIAESAYPLLSVCADNLLPVCGDCNSTSNKGQKPVHTGGIFNDWFHPYKRHANGDIGGIGMNYSLRTLSITAVAKNPADTAKVANLDALLNLSKRWTRQFKEEYAKQQGVLVGRERRRIGKNQPRHTPAEILAHLQEVKDDLLETEPHYEVHSTLLAALLDDPARLDAWKTELELAA